MYKSHWYNIMQHIHNVQVLLIVKRYSLPSSSPFFLNIHFILWLQYLFILDVKYKVNLIKCRTLNLLRSDLRWADPRISISTLLDWDASFMYDIWLTKRMTIDTNWRMVGNGQWDVYTSTLYSIIFHQSWWLVHVPTVSLATEEIQVRS